MLLSTVINNMDSGHMFRRDAWPQLTWVTLYDGGFLDQDGEPRCLPFIDIVAEDWQQVQVRIHSALHLTCRDVGHLVQLRDGTIAVVLAQNSIGTFLVMREWYNSDGTHVALIHDRDRDIIERYNGEEMP